MQKKKARKGFLFLRRESVLPPCRAGPVCPAGTNAVFCGGTHGSRPTDRCGKPSVGDGVLDVPSAPRCKAPSVRGCRRSRLGERKTVGRLSLRQRFALPPPSQREALVVRPLDKPAGMGIIINTRGRCIRRSVPCVRDFYLGLMTNKNRHLSEWRFLPFNFITRIETEYRPM